MLPLDTIQRLNELGVTLDVNELPSVHNLDIDMDSGDSQFATLLTSMQPRTVHLPGLQMTTDDVPGLLNFPHLTAICAHQIPFASALLATGLPFPRLSSVAMSHTTLDDNDMTRLRNKTTLRSLHFTSTRITDDSLVTFATLPSLELLDLRDTQISDTGLMHLTNLKCLFTINARGTLVTPGGANEFRCRVAKWLPDVEVLL